MSAPRGDRPDGGIAGAEYVPSLAPGGLEIRWYAGRHGPYAMVKHLGRGAYARLAPEDEFILRRIDGRRTVRDLVLDYFAAHRAFAYERVVGVVEQLRAAGFLVDPPRAVRLGPGSRLLALGRAALYREFPLPDADRLASRAYQAGGRWLFAPVPAFLLALTAVIGLPLFVLQTLRRPGGVPRVGDSALLTGVVALALFLLVIALHEAAHALAVKHYAREVRRAGFALYLLAPSCFVDTTDIWLASPRARLVSVFAGVFSGFVLGGLASVARLVVGPGTVADGLLAEGAFLGYATSAVNLLPLLELDGYYMLVDLLDMPRLRERSFAFLTGDLPRKLRRWEPWSPDERILAAYGLLAAPTTAMAIGMALLAWHDWLALLVAAALGRG